MTCLSLNGISWIMTDSEIPERCKKFTVPYNDLQNADWGEMLIGSHFPLKNPDKSRDFQFRRGMSRVRFQQARIQYSRDSSKAFEYILRGLSWGPDIPDVLREAARLYIKFQKPEIAVNHLKKAIRLSPTDEASYLILSSAYKALGRENEAAEAKEKYNTLFQRYFQVKD